MYTEYVCEIDGTRFDSERACAEYERKLINKTAEGIVSGFGDKGAALSFSDYDFCQDVEILFLKNEEAVKLFCDRARYEGLSEENIDKPGIYVWGDGKWREGCEYCDWNKISDVIAGYQSIINNLKDFIAAFEEN